MARCPFAQWMPLSGSGGSVVGGPFRVVHHTTEGSSAAGAFQAFKAHRSDPHFTVDEQRVYQHIDTSVAARALRNAIGGVETNRLEDTEGSSPQPDARGATYSVRPSGSVVDTRTPRATSSSSAPSVSSIGVVASKRWI